ncbi:hypothetical protein M885DRAFT_520835 [Pelagophyceae sp. CCMP2097]|nr:hypothetical protein M885DRAFT_520835 [Pelagophyceae sp. CCMP2097]|mmetsp:Transcript_6138/g.19676  ORF Transcript_6138/g.19676 Transcript_6138/m.19676 type:complete len:181 (-) Transcript_6138:73-615(-)
MESKRESKDDDDAPKRSRADRAEGKDDDAEGKDDAAGEVKDDGDDMLRDVFDFYYESTELEAALQKFCFANASTFDDDHRRKGEYTLEHTRVHHAFRQLFEDFVEAHIRELGRDVSSFYRSVAADQRRSTELYSGHTFAAVINGAMSFDNFYDMMLDAKRGEFFWGVPLLQDMDTLEFLY